MVVTSIVLINENGFTLKKKREDAKDKLQKLLQMQAIVTTECFSQTPTNAESLLQALSKQRDAVTYMVMRINRVHEY